MQLGARLTAELDEIAPCLLRKAGEMSTAGRDSFLAQNADAALSQMVLSCPESSCAKCLMAMCATPAPLCRPISDPHKPGCRKQTKLHAWRHRTHLRAPSARQVELCKRSAACVQDEDIFAAHPPQGGWPPGRAPRQVQRDCVPHK